MLGEILLLRFTGHFDISILGGTNMDIVCGETTASTEGSEAVFTDEVCFCLVPSHNIIPKQKE